MEGGGAPNGNQINGTGGTGDYTERFEGDANYEHDDTHQFYEIV